MPYIDTKYIGKCETCRHHSDSGCDTWCDCGECYQPNMSKIPTADVVEVRHGTWTLHKNGSGTCDQCHFTQRGVWDYDNWQRYCGCCGAKMDNINCEEWAEENYESKNHRRKKSLGFRRQY